jgi:hypothetical protein
MIFEILEFLLRYLKRLSILLDELVYLRPLNFNELLVKIESKDVRPRKDLHLLTVPEEWSQTKFYPEPFEEVHSLNYKLDIFVADSFLGWNVGHIDPRPIGAEDRSQAVEVGVPSLALEASKLVPPMDLIGDKGIIDQLRVVETPYLVV